MSEAIVKQAFEATWVRSLIKKISMRFLVWMFFRPVAIAARDRSDAEKSVGT